MYTRCGRKTTGFRWGNMTYSDDLNLPEDDDDFDPDDEYYSEDEDDEYIFDDEDQLVDDRFDRWESEGASEI